MAPPRAFPVSMHRCPDRLAPLREKVRVFHEEANPFPIISTVAELQARLQDAIDLELFLLPPYLTAAQTIKNPNDSVRGLLASVPPQEMSHLAIALNLMVACGGVPKLAPQPYPMKLAGNAHPEIQLPVAHFSVELIQTFQAIEEPEWNIINRGGSHTIGQFYARIEQAFRSNVVTTFLQPKQRVPPFGMASKITSVDDAVSAIQRIVLEGEGSIGSPVDENPPELGHFYRFSEVVEGRKYSSYDPVTRQAKYEGPVIQIPQADDIYQIDIHQYGPYQDPAAEAAAQAFLERFKKILSYLLQAWSADDDETGNRLLNIAIYTEMMNLFGAFEETSYFETKKTSIFPRFWDVGARQLRNQGEVDHTFIDALQHLAKSFHREDLRLSIDPLIAPSKLYGAADDYNYFLNSLSNRRFAYRPFCVISFKSKDLEKNIAAIQKFLALVQARAPKSQSEYQIKIHSGGHQHEGECSGDRAIVFDLSRMDAVAFDPARKTLTLGPGIQFVDLYHDEAVQKYWIGIPSGACQTVAVAGFTLGGGWGPFARKHGMGCDSLIGATVILHDGAIVRCDETHDSDLLWALRGGGLGFGIVVQFVFRTFERPDCYVDFSVTFDTAPTLRALEIWKELILSDETAKLLGTNFLITPMAKEDLTDPIDKAIFAGSCFNGNYDGTEDEFREFIAKKFPDMVSDIDLTVMRKLQISSIESPLCAFAHWDRRLKDVFGRRLILEKVKPKAMRPLVDPTAILLNNGEKAPHYLTSRMAGPGVAMHNILQSCVSEYLPTKAQSAHDDAAYSVLHSASVTLGCIAGSYYKTPSSERPDSAFPYKDKAFIVQYQQWWNRSPLPNDNGDWRNVTLLDCSRYANVAMNWIDHAKDAPIDPHVTGAFLSFINNAVPLGVYFDVETLERLVAVKKKYLKKDTFALRKSIPLF